MLGLLGDDNDDAAVVGGDDGSDGFVFSRFGDWVGLVVVVVVGNVRC